MEYKPSQPEIFIQKLECLQDDVLSHLTERQLQKAPSVFGYSFDDWFAMTGKLSRKKAVLSLCAEAQIVLGHFRRVDFFEGRFSTRQPKLRLVK